MLAVSTIFKFTSVSSANSLIWSSMTLIERRNKTFDWWTICNVTVQNWRNEQYNMQDATIKCTAKHQQQCTFLTLAGKPSINCGLLIFSALNSSVNTTVKSEQVQSSAKFSSTFNVCTRGSNVCQLLKHLQVTLTIPRATTEICWKRTFYTSESFTPQIHV